MTPPVFTAQQGAQVTLRPFEPADISPAYIAWLNDPDVVRYSNQRFRTHTEATSQAYLASFADSPNHFLAICRTTDGSVVGTMTLYRTPVHGTADMGIMVGDRACWGQGIGQDAWNTAMAWLFSDPTMRKVTAGTMRPNQGMVRLCERSHMTQEAVRPAQELLDGTPQDILYFGRFNDR